MRRIIVTPAASGLALLAILATGRAIRGGEQGLRGPFMGSYEATLKRAQAAAPGDPPPVGLVPLGLRPNGTYTDSNPPDGTDEGRVARLAHGQLRFYDDRYCKLGGPERRQGGIYRWSLNGERLTLRLVNEGGCTGRSDTLTFPVWVRK